MGGCPTGGGYGQLLFPVVGGADVDYFELEGYLSVPFVFIDGEDHIEGLFVCHEGEFISHVETYTGEGSGGIAGILADGELDVFFFDDTGVSAVDEVAGQEYGSEVVGAQRFELTEDVKECRGDIGQCDLGVDDDLGDE